MGRPHIIHLYPDPAVWVQPKVVFSRSWGLGFRLNGYSQVAIYHEIQQPLKASDKGSKGSLFTSDGDAIVHCSFTASICCCQITIFMNIFE